MSASPPTLPLNVPPPRKATPREPASIVPLPVSGPLSTAALVLTKESVLPFTSRAPESVTLSACETVSDVPSVRSLWMRQGLLEKPTSPVRVMRLPASSSSPRHVLGPTLVPAGMSKVTFRRDCVAGNVRSSVAAGTPGGLQFSGLDQVASAAAVQERRTAYAGRIGSPRKPERRAPLREAPRQPHVASCTSERRDGWACKKRTGVDAAATAR